MELDNLVGNDKGEGTGGRSARLKVPMHRSPDDLFRPSPDREVTDHEAVLNFPPDGFRKYNDTNLVYSEMPCDAT